MTGGIKSLLYIGVLLFLHAGFFLYLDAQPCSDGYCATIIYPLFIPAVGFLIALNPFGRFSWKEFLLITIVVSLFIFTLFFWTEVSLARKVLQNPGKYPGFGDDIALHGDWFGWYRGIKYYTDAIWAIGIVFVGIFIGLGARNILERFILPTPLGKKL